MFSHFSGSPTVCSDNKSNDTFPTTSFSANHQVPLLHRVQSGLPPLTIVSLNPPLNSLY